MLLDIKNGKIYPISYYKSQLKCIFIKSNKCFFEIDLLQPNSGTALLNFLTCYSKTKNIYNKFHKYILLRNFNFLSKKYQYSLRRIIEICVKNIRFIIITSKYSSVIHALKSRLLPIRVSSPDDKDAIKIIENILQSENVVIDNKMKQKIIDQSKCGSSGIIHLKEMFMVLECSILLSKKKSIVYISERNKAVNDLVQYCKKKDIEKIRNTLQKINSYMKDDFIEIVTCDLYRKLYPFAKNKQKFIERTAYWNSIICRDYIQYTIFQAEAYLFEIIHLI